jgi:hypothetical protein
MSVRIDDGEMSSSYPTQARNICGLEQALRLSRLLYNG